MCSERMRTWVQSAASAHILVMIVGLCEEDGAHLLRHDVRLFEQLLELSERDLAVFVLV